MKLEDKFFKSFFYPFILCTILCTLVVTLFLIFFTNNNYDRRALDRIINIEKKYSKININSVSILLTTTIQKIQAGLNENIILYQRYANKLLDSTETPAVNDTYMKCALTTSFMICFFEYEETYKYALWSLDEETTEYDLDSKEDTKKQLSAFSNLIPIMNSSLEAAKPNSYGYSFYFEENELFISYPIMNLCNTNDIMDIVSVPYSYDGSQCLDEKGEFYTVYKYKCEIYFKKFKKSKTFIFDNNYLPKRNKTILISNFYEYNSDLADKKFTLCIEFDDPITKGKGYSCGDYRTDDIINSLENLNSNVLGYYFITIVGHNHVFYFPNGPINPFTVTENIFNWDTKFTSTEKSFFYDNIKNFFTSNYIDSVGNSIFPEVYVNGKDDSMQYFFLNEKKYKYSIYPVILENLYGEKEHVFSIIYVYSDELYLEEIKNNNNSSIVIKILLELVIFIVFGFGLLYIIYLTFNILSKYIVIPIKNVNYMLKGINIGGNNRLKYLDFLKKKQDDNLEILEKKYLSEVKRINTSDEIFSEIENSNSINQVSSNDSIKESQNLNQNQYSDFNEKYDEESNYIEKEYSFYDFDEQLLQYRPLEIEHLVKSLIDLKGVLLLTSEDREAEKIIDYSSSEEIFRNFKNNKGSTICHSNIGNLQSQLLQYDKAIYHLALSLQDNQLKRFLSRNINDELDENNALLNTISNLFIKQKKLIKNNILSQKQKNKSKENISQKIIGIMINTRYCRLIKVYYMFFKNLQKLQKSDSNIMNGQFMNTLFHTINYYNKVLIQYIYLCYSKNDLVKIGESILDYIQFLLKFKFKTSSEEKYFLKIRNKERPEFQEKQNIKKKIFEKILKWFNLVDSYISHIKENTSLGDDKSIVDIYSHSLNSENMEFNLESQGAFMFRINIQRNNFLKGKFCLYCKNYNDALFYFICAAKKKSIVIDGLIKKKSLKHIFKLLNRMKKKFEKMGLKNLNIEKRMEEYKKENKIITKKINSGRKKINSLEKFKDINGNTFGEEIDKIKIELLHDIYECNAKKEKDILILIDFNIYDQKKDDNLYAKTSKIDAFIEETVFILNNYLSANDRFGVIIYSNKCLIICPLMFVNHIDSNSFSKDLINYKNKTFKENNEPEEYDINLNEFKINDLDFNLGENNNITEYSQEEISNSSQKEDNYYKQLNGLVKAINYINDYSKMKEGVKNEKYIILFTDILNVDSIEDEQIEKIFENLKKDEDVIFLLVGKNKNINMKNIANIDNLILNKFGAKSEVIYFENTKRIKTILFNNNAIKDEIIYPNEIYK